MVFYLKSHRTFWAICAFILLCFTTTNAQTALITENFQALTINPSITSDGVVSPTKAADGVCSKGMIQVNSGGYLQVDVSNCSTFVVNMKSTASSARAVTVKYKKQGDAAFTGATTTLSVQLAASFDFHTLYPNIVTNAPITVRIEPTSGNIQIHDLIVTGNTTLSNAAEIMAFKLPNQIGTEVINTAAGTISLNLPTGTNVTAIMPQTITLSSGASINPTPSVSRNFSSPVTYTVTAQDNSTKVWTITVTLLDPNATYTDYQAEDADFTGVVKTDHLNYTGTGFIDFLTAANYMTFTVCQQTAGNQTLKFRYSFAKDEVRTANLFINNVATGQVLFPRTTTFDDWIDAIAVVNLQQGINTIKLTWDLTDGPNLDKLLISGAQCNNYLLTTSATNSGTVTKSPIRKNNRYFEGEQVTVTAVGAISSSFSNWSGDLTGTTNPSVITMNAAKSIVANFTVVSTYKLTVNAIGLGEVTMNPTAANGTYAVGTVVTLTATPLLSSSFINWTGDASGTTLTTTVTLNSDKTVTANFTSSYTFNFNKVVGFASMAGDGFAGPTTGGQCAADTVVINGPSEFNKLCETLYYRQRVYAGRTPNGGLKKAPLVILLKAGVYDGTQPLSAIGGNTYANSMMDIPEQGDLTFLGESNVVFKIGINVKRAWNILIRNIAFFDFADDGINVGYPETHHIWIDHCSLGNPTTIPANTEVPDGACDVKDGASFVTISFCKFQHHWKTSLNGHSDNNGATDAGRLKITYYANYFYSSNSRHPRVRFGEVHVLNNMYENVGLGRTGHFGYGLSASNNASVYAEGNFFLDTRWPMLADRTTADFATVYGAALTSPNSNTPCFGLKSVNNAYDDSGLTQTIVGQLNPAMINPSGLSVKFDELITPNFTLNPSTYYNYSSSLLPAAAVRVLIPQYAGADKISFATNCTTIPLNLIHFSANKIDNSNAIQLNWQTANEEHVSHFLLERSSDGLNFNPLGIIAARNTKAINDYVFTDNTPLNSINYYRLRMVDFDGKETFSKVISLKDNATIKNSLKAYPSVSDAILTVETTSNDAATLKIVDVLGRVLMTKQIEASNTILSQSINIGALPNGVYSIILENKDGRLIEKFIKQ